MRGEPLAPLHGLPVSIKDLVPTAGIAPPGARCIFAEHVPEADAEVVTRLKASGAIIVGKTTTPEFGQQCLTEAPLFGRTRNAWDAGRTSGGSSGGAAVAAAAGWPRSASPRTAAARPGSPPPATASSASSRGSASCRRNTPRTGSATSPT